MTARASRDFRASRPPAGAPDAPPPRPPPGRRPPSTSHTWPPAHPRPLTGPGDLPPSSTALLVILAVPRRMPSSVIRTSTDRRRCKSIPTICRPSYAASTGASHRRRWRRHPEHERPGALRGAEAPLLHRIKGAAACGLRVPPLRSGQAPDSELSRQDPAPAGGTGENRTFASSREPWGPIAAVLPGLGRSHRSARSPR